MSVSTHVLDAAAGRPAPGVPVRLEHRGETGWEHRDAQQTNADGRVPVLAGADVAGVYRLTFEVEGHLGGAGFYPEVVVVFRVTDAAAHHHVPLLLSPYAYSTYRGS